MSLATLRNATRLALAGVVKFIGQKDSMGCKGTERLLKWR